MQIIWPVICRVDMVEISEKVHDSNDGNPEFLMIKMIEILIM